MTKILLAFSFTIVLNIFSFAQATDDYNKGEFFAGYSSSSNLDEQGRLRGTVRGFEVAGVYNVHRYIGIKGAVSAGFSSGRTIRFTSSFVGSNPAAFGYNERASIYNYVGGVQLKNNSSDAILKPFAHVMVGAGQFRNKVTNAACPAGQNCALIPASEVSTGFSIIGGGGLDISLSDKIDVRLAQIDFNGISYNHPNFSSSSYITTVRFGAGIVFK